MTISYATLAQLEIELDTSGGTEAQQSRLLDYGRTITQRIDHYPKLAYEFAPRIQTVYHDCTPHNTLDLWQPFLEITSVTLRGVALTEWDGDYSTITDTSYMIMPRDERLPTDQLKRLDGRRWWPITYNSHDELHGAIAVTGITGYRRYYADAWQNTATLAANANTSVTTVTVSDASAFSVGALLRINDEFLELTDVGTDTDTLTVVRGARGSTAASHTSGDTVEVWLPEPEIVRAVTRWANYLKTRRGNFSNFSVDGLGASTQMPADMPKEIKNILAAFPYIPFPAFVV